MINPFIFSFILPRVSTSSSRGMVSLAVEPSYYGLIMLFYIILIYLFYENKNKNHLILFLMFQIVFLARSSFIFLLLVFLLFIISLLKKPIIVFLIMFVFSFMYGFILNFIPIFFPGRLGSVLKNLASDPLELVMMDGSVNDRVFHIIYTVKGFFDNYMLPHGFNGWSAYIHLQRTQSIYADQVSTGKILSAFGSSLFELGFFGFLLILAFNKVFFLIKVKSNKKYIFSLLFFNVFFFMPIPLSLPLTSLLLVYFIVL